MATVLVFTEHKSGIVKSGTLELVCAAKASGNTVKAVSFGPNTKALSDELSKYGVSEYFYCESDSFSFYNPELYAEQLSGLLKAQKFDVVLASGSALAKDLIPRVAARLGCGVASDCTDLKITGTTVSATKPLYAGKCSAAVTFSNSPVQFVVMRPNQLPVGAAGASGGLTATALSPVNVSLGSIIKDVVQGTASKLDLTEANIIVSGGRGLKGPENFKILQDMADVLGAAVGASRAAVDEGWVPHSYQVGQTGKTVSPTLYIACGISGMIQHLAGMSSSKVIVAINNNPDAPIFKKATYGIVGDLFEVVPMLTQEFKKLLGK